MQQNFEILDVSMYVASSFSIVIVKETVHVLQPHFEASVRMKLTLPKVGTWSPSKLPKTQSLIIRSKHVALMCFLHCWKGLEV
jgi:hypothetical protein